MADEVRAFLRCKKPHRGRHQRDDLGKAARASGAKERFEFRKRELDRIEVGTVRRQESHVGARALDRGLGLRLFVHGEIIEDDHIPGPQRRDEHLLDVGEEGRIVDGTIEDRRRVPAVPPEGRDPRVRLPNGRTGV